MILSGIIDTQGNGQIFMYLFEKSEFPLKNCRNVFSAPALNKLVKSIEFSSVGGI